MLEGEENRRARPLIGEDDIQAHGVSYDEDKDEIIVDLVNGRRVHVPVKVLPELNRMDRRKLRKIRLLADGIGIEVGDGDEFVNIVTLIGLDYGYLIDESIRDEVRKHERDSIHRR